MEKRKHYSRLGTLPKARFWHGREAEFNNKSMHYKQEEKKNSPKNKQHPTPQTQTPNYPNRGEKCTTVLTKDPSGDSNHFLFLMCMNEM